MMIAMPQTLSRLRMDLDFMPSPVSDRPGLLIRDPFQYSTATLIVPPPLVGCLEFFDGQSTDLDLRAHLVKLTGELEVGEIEEHLTRTLHDAGFLVDDVFETMREDRHRGFAAAGKRYPSHAGSAYPADAVKLAETLCGYLKADGAEQNEDSLIGVAAPHVSLDGGWQCYAAAYSKVTPAYRDRVFVILGTSHYGQPERFGLTRKPFVTPLGEAKTETALADRLIAEAPGAVIVEDYCHAIEHSIEFQVVFLQHLFGPEVRILPVLCGPFAQSIYAGGRPEDAPEVNSFFAALRRIAEEEGDRLFWVLGVDMAHMGRRYGDSFAATAGEREMEEVAALDAQRIERLKGQDADGFWATVQQDRDPIKWCGSSPLYTFLRAKPEAAGELLKYQQWNIDDESVVTFAGMTFRA
jgi:MEMO1 family protein